jgi:predicted transposase/invertase (TIGR01784 family)
VWQEAHEEGVAEGSAKGRTQGREEGRETERRQIVRKMAANGFTAKKIAEIMDIAVEEVRRLTKNA